MRETSVCVYANTCVYAEHTTIEKQFIHSLLCDTGKVKLNKLNGDV